MPAKANRGWFHCKRHGCNRSFRSKAALGAHEYHHKRHIVQQARVNYPVVLTTSSSGTLRAHNDDVPPMDAELLAVNKVLQAFRALQPHSQSFVVSQMARGFDTKVTG